MMPQQFLFNFASRLPRHRVRQDEGSSWLARAHAAFDQTEDALKASALLERVSGYPKRVEYRYTELADPLHSDWNAMLIAPENGMAERMAFFERMTDHAVAELLGDFSRPPQHLVHVTCTGYSSPSAPQKFVAARGWGQDTTVTHAYHMGCYAAIPAIRLAHNHAVIVHTELCTLHLNPLDHRPDQLVVQTLFADGHIRYEVSDHMHGPGGLAIFALHEEILPDSAQAMTWVCSDFGMQMTLSVDTPEYIANAVDGFVLRLAARAGIDYDLIAKKALYAIHPGGPKIIDRVQEVLKLSNEQTQHSKDILRQRGNMSSATLPHIWQKIVDDTEIPEGTLIVSMAFGPGLTVAGALMRKC
jgi:predicted naringenin-chalcone synthase